MPTEIDNSVYIGLVQEYIDCLHVLKNDYMCFNKWFFMSKECF